jgi:amino acid efflux transporter
MKTMLIRHPAAPSRAGSAAAGAPEAGGPGAGVPGSGAPAPGLSVPRGTALYIGALLGPGLLLLPGLAAAEAGPASLLAWLGLLGLSALLAVVFAALGKRLPGESGVAAYTAAGLGQPAAAAAGWCFLAGVVLGAPVVCLIGASYVTGLTGGGHTVTCAVAATLLLAVLSLALVGVRATTTAQLILVALLIAVTVVAVTGSVPAARAANWTPFAPHGWAAIGRAASTLMLSFVGWEAVAPLTGRFRDPARELPRVIATAFAVTAVLYLALAVATIAVLGRGAATDVPLARLLLAAIGAPGRAAAAVTAVVLTLGTTNAYVSGAATMAMQLTRRPPGKRSRERFLLAARRPAAQRSARPFLAVIGLAGIALIGLYWLRLVSTAQLVGLPATLFLAVYLGCTVSGVRTLAGRPRLAAGAAAVAVALILLFSGWALAVAAAVAATAAVSTASRRGAQAGLRRGAPCGRPTSRCGRRRPGPPAGRCARRSSRAGPG